MKKVLIAIGLLSLCGCKSSHLAQIESLGSHFYISCYSGGKIIAQYESTGQPSNEEHSDGFFFEDASTAKLVEVSGTCVFKQK